MFVQNEKPKGKGKGNVRRSIGCLLAIPLSCVAMISLGWAYSFFVTQFGRIHDFVPLSSETTIPGTDYRFVFRPDQYAMDDIYLVNDTTHEEHELSLALYAEGYALLDHDGKLYLIYRSSDSGSNSATNYRILDISGDVPQWIDIAQSCSNPRLIGDSLEFYKVRGDCDLFPFVHPLSTVQVPLDKAND